eukprot:3544278-Amphidinium_carterae.1
MTESACCAATLKMRLMSQRHVLWPWNAKPKWGATESHCSSAGTNIDRGLPTILQLRCAADQLCTSGVQSEHQILDNSFDFVPINFLKHDRMNEPVSIRLWRVRLQSADWKDAALAKLTAVAEASKSSKELESALQENSAIQKTPP